MNKLLPLISLLALLTISQAVTTFELESLWETWKNRYQKSYDATEELFRFGVFSHNYKRIIKFNQENDTPKLALNHFADLTKDEFKSFYTNGGFYGSDRNEGQQQVIEEVDVGSLPASIDWRNRGAVTPVKNQGQCGACWAFSATGVLEGFYFVNNGKLLSFSEQQIVDCDTNGTSYGCNGGFPTDAVNYTIKYGLETEADYPYTATQGQCNYNASLAYHIANGYAKVTPNSTDHLKAALVKNPVSIVIEADQDVVEFYSSGVIKTGCGAVLDHCVLAVGYHKNGVLESFIVKNSWGTDWGESGYAEIWSNGQQNGGQGVCGILAEPMVPTK